MEDHIPTGLRFIPSEDVSIPCWLSPVLNSLDVSTDSQAMNVGSEAEEDAGPAMKDSGEETPVSMTSP